MSKRALIITQLRTYRPDYTQSELYIAGGERFCHVLEDKKQPPGVKIPGETCIPEGAYRVSITLSTRWLKPMMLLSNTKDGAVERDGIRFTGIRPHGGNDIDDTEGCPLCAYKQDGMGRIWQRASDDIFDIVEAAIIGGQKVYWVISSIQP